jgi:hypothetical protein
MANDGVGSNGATGTPDTLPRPDFHFSGSVGRTARKFTGDVNWVEIDVGGAGEDLDHLITPDERLAVAMALQ